MKAELEPGMLIWLLFARRGLREGAIMQLTTHLEGAGVKRPALVVPPDQERRF